MEVMEKEVEETAVDCNLPNGPSDIKKLESLRDQAKRYFYLNLGVCAIIGTTLACSVIILKSVQ